MTKALHPFDSVVQLVEAATNVIVTAAAQAIAERGKFKLVLAGGSTPNAIYQRLAQLEADWQNWWIYWGDERCLAADDKERNSVMAMQAWLSKVAIPHSQIFVMPTEQGIKAAAAAYRGIVADALPFDLVLLGMGEDGHTASLFPHHVHHPNELVHEVTNSPKPPPERISLSAKALSTSRQVIFLITGYGKRDAFAQWQQGTELPVAQIQPPQGISIYLDSSVMHC